MTAAVGARNLFRVDAGVVHAPSFRSRLRRVIFARDGFLNSTIAEIMKEAQRSIGVFYRYYKSKDELLLELTEEFRQKLLHQIHMPLQPKQDPIKNFEEKLGTFWQLYADDWAIVNSALQMSMVDEAFAKRWHDLRRQGIIVAITHVISKAKKLGYCPTIDPHYAASALCSMLGFTCYNWTSRWGDFAGAKEMSKGHARVGVFGTVSSIIMTTPRPCPEGN
jgi:AcrR family transcriptional regulator